jgi:hypothetical protein
MELFLYKGNESIIANTKGKVEDGVTQNEADFKAQTLKMQRHS